MHDGPGDGGELAEMLLAHIGHGSLPYDADPQLFDPEPADEVTHLAFRVRLRPGQDVPRHDLRPTWLTYINSPGIEMNPTGMSWRSPQTPWVTHEADFTRPIDAAIAPERWVNASDRYTARFDEGRAPSASTSSTRHGRRAGTSSIVGPAGRSRTMSSVIPYTRGTGYPHAARGVIKRD